MLKYQRLTFFPWHLLENHFNKKQTALAFCEEKKMESLVTQLAVKLVLNKKNDYALVKGSSSTCVGYHHSKRLE